MGAMNPTQIRRRRLELGLTVGELAMILNVTESELSAIENGSSELYMSAAFEEAFAILEERVFGTFCGA